MKKKTTLDLPEALHRRLKKEAAKKDTSVGSIIRRACLFYLEVATHKIVCKEEQ